jgi:hypothetical protein
MIMKRVLKLIRQRFSYDQSEGKSSLKLRFPYTHILARGDGHFSNPELMQLIDAMPNTDFIFGLAGNANLLRSAEPTLKQARALYAQRQAFGENTPIRLYEEFDYAAKSWDKPHRAILKAEVMALGDNPRFVVTSMRLPDPHTIYTELYCARGNAENFIKFLKCDLSADRTSCTTFLANCMRFLLHSAAYILHQQLRTQALQHTELKSAQPISVILKLFKVATQVKKYKDRVILHLPSAYPFKHLLWQMTERLYLPKPFRFNSS